MDLESGDRLEITAAPGTHAVVSLAPGEILAVDRVTETDGPTLVTASVESTGARVTGHWTGRSLSEIRLLDRRLYIGGRLTTRRARPDGDQQ